MTTRVTHPTMRTTYERCAEAEVPDGVRFDVPRRNQGQIVEVAYGGFDQAEHDVGDPYKRVHDQSDRSTTYYRLRRAGA